VLYASTLENGPSFSLDEKASQLGTQNGAIINNGKQIKKRYNNFERQQQHMKAL